MFVRVTRTCLPILLFAASCAKDEGGSPSAAGSALPKPPPVPSSQPSAVPNPHGDEFKNRPPPGAPFSGLVKLGEGIPADSVKPTDVLFIMARESQGEGFAGRLVAVQRHSGVEFPKRYELSAKDLMVPGMAFQGPFVLTARLDKDGDPMTRGDDDLYATYVGDVKPGQDGVHLELKKGKPATIPMPSNAPQLRGGDSPTPHPASQPSGTSPH